MLILRRSKLYFYSIWYRHSLWAAVQSALNRYNCTLSLTSALEGTRWSKPRLGLFISEKDPVPLAQKDRWAAG
jgi:hypothetical protein